MIALFGSADSTTLPLLLYQQLGAYRTVHRLDDRRFLELRTVNASGAAEDAPLHDAPPGSSGRFESPPNHFRPRRLS